MKNMGVARSSMMDPFFFPLSLLLSHLVTMGDAFCCLSCRL